jgi:hypothetical protein
MEATLEYLFILPPESLEKNHCFRGVFILVNQMKLHGVTSWCWQRRGTAGILLAAS